LNVFAICDLKKQESTLQPCRFSTACFLSLSILCRWRKPFKSVLGFDDVQQLQLRAVMRRNSRMNFEKQTKKRLKTAVIHDD